MKKHFENIRENSRQLNKMAKQADNFLQDLEDQLFDLSICDSFYFVNAKDLQSTIGYGRLSKEHRKCILFFDASCDSMQPISTAPPAIRIGVLPYLEKLVEEIAKKVEESNFNSMKVMSSFADKLGEFEHE